jgi:probable HAF family extracellular repeat protein
LGTLAGSDPARFSEGLSVNSTGQVAGASDTAAGAVHAFLSGPGGGPLQDLGTLGGNSAALGVNDSGQAVGFFDLSASTRDEHAFLFSGGVMTDLNSLIALGSGFTLEQANGISDTGYICGTGLSADGQEHAFLLTPVPEASSVVSLGALLALGLGGAAAAGVRVAPQEWRGGPEGAGPGGAGPSYGAGDGRLGRPPRTAA